MLTRTPHKAIPRLDLTNSVVLRLAARKKSRRILCLRIALGTALLALVVFLPLHFPSSVNSVGAVTCAQKWVLLKGVDGRLMASTFNYQTGLSEGYRVSNFESGSFVNFSLSPSIVGGRNVAMGDTIGSVYSSEMQERLIMLNGQLAAARGALAVKATGQKAAIIDDAQQRLDFAKRRREEHHKVELRSQKLIESSLISQAEYELVQDEASALEDEIQIAEAGLETARTGDKPEQIQLLNANILALEKEIDAVKRRATTYTLTAPLSGTVSPAFSRDTLLTISDTAKYVALIPIKASDYGRVSSIQNPQLTLRGLTKTLRGKVIALNREIQVLHGQRVFIVAALLEESTDDLIPGMLARCRIECRPLTALEHLKAFFSVATSNGSF